MRENGFLDPEMSMGTIRELLHSKPQNVKTIQKSATVRDAVKIMKELGISQMPVTDDGHLAGLVTESRLLDLMIAEGEQGLDVNVGSVLSKEYEIVDPDAPIALYQRSFTQNKVLVVWARGFCRRPRRCRKRCCPLWTSP